MPALKPTAFHARITWLGRITGQADVLDAEPATAVFAGFSGIGGEVHSGLTRASCSRVTGQYPRGTEIRNTRQVSILSDEELSAIAFDMGLESLSPSLLGATVVLRGIPDFSHVPPGSRLIGTSGASLVVDMENRPCSIPARAIERAHPGKGATFKPAAAGRRGVTAWVEREGVFRLGDSVRLHIPDQPVWACIEMARAEA